MIISAKFVKKGTKEYWCAQCNLPIPRGTESVLCFGAAEYHDPPYQIRIHGGCASYEVRRKVPELKTEDDERAKRYQKQC